MQTTNIRFNGKPVTATLVYGTVDEYGFEQDGAEFLFSSDRVVYAMATGLRVGFAEPAAEEARPC